MTQPVTTRRLAIRLIIMYTLLGLLLFVPAGTIRWPEAWIFLVSQMIFSVSLTAWLQKHDPALLRERMTFMKKSAKSWDKPIVLAFSVLSIPFYMLAGLDAMRYHWSHVPVPVRIVSFGGLIVAAFLVVGVMRENTFLTPVVEIQTDRGHKVISSGPYALVRHPMYLGMTLMIFCLPLFLGSLWTLTISAVIALLLFVRTAMEDRMLHRELDGYAEYASRVRYRIIPGLW